jgi:hypothetical protein
LPKILRIPAGASDSISERLYQELLLLVGTQAAHLGAG